MVLSGLVWLQKKQKNSIVKNLTNTPSVPKNRHLKSLKSDDNVYYQHFIVKNITKFFMCSTQKNAFNRTVFCVFSQYACFNMVLNFVVSHKKNSHSLYFYTKKISYTCIQYKCIHEYHTIIHVYININCIQSYT